MKIKKIEKKDGNFSHYDLTVGKNHNFFAEEILTHNCNLPARNVVIVGTHRGINDVDSLEIIQEIGRSGRYGIDSEGFAYIIVPEGTSMAWEHKIRNPRPVNSVLNQHQILAFHVLSEIANKKIIDEKSLMSWFSRSLAYKQNIYPFTEIDAKGLLDDLKNMNMIEYNGNLPYVTGLGKVSHWYYFSPYDVFSWYSNFEKVYASNTEMDDEALAYCIGNIPSNDPGYVTKDMQGVASEWQWRLRNRGLACGNAVLSVIAAHEKLTGTDEIGGIIPVLKRNIAFDIKRVVSALSLIDGLYAKWGKEILWEGLPTRIQYGIPSEMLELVKIPGVGGVRAKQLWEQGFHNVADITKATEAMIANAVGNNLARKIRAAAVKLEYDNKKQS